MTEGAQRYPGGFRLTIREDVGSDRWLVVTVRYWPPKVWWIVFDWEASSLRLLAAFEQVTASFRLAARAAREFGESMRKVAAVWGQG